MGLSETLDERRWFDTANVVVGLNACGNVVLDEAPGGSGRFSIGAELGIKTDESVVRDRDRRDPGGGEVILPEP